MNEERLRGVCVGYVTQERSKLKQFLMRRAIIIGGPAIADDATDEEVICLMSAVRAQLKSQAIYVETRNFNDYSRWKEAFAKAGFSYEPHLNFHVHTDQGWEAVEENIGKHRKKYIRLSFRDGATIKELKHEGVNELENLKLLKDYYAILEDLYKTKVKMPLQPWSFFEKLYHLDSCKYLLVMYDGQVVGGSICMLLNKNTQNPVPEINQENIIGNQKIIEKNTGLSATCSTPNNLDHMSAQEQALGQPSAQSCSIDSVTQTLSDNPSQKIPKNSDNALQNNGGGVYEWYACGKDGVFKNIHPSSVTKYAGMKYAADNGYAVFDMMGAGKPDEEYGVRDFKAEFGGELVEYGRWLAVTKPLMYKIGVLGVKILKKIK